jgi:hypothetical protein
VLAGTDDHMRAGLPSGETDDGDEGMYGDGAGEGDAEDMVVAEKTWSHDTRDVTALPVLIDQ